MTIYEDGLPRMASGTYSSRIENCFVFFLSGCRGGGLRLDLRHARYFHLIWGHRGKGHACHETFKMKLIGIHWRICFRTDKWDDGWSNDNEYLSVMVLEHIRSTAIPIRALVPKKATHPEYDSFPWRGVLGAGQEGEGRGSGKAP